MYTAFAASADTKLRMEIHLKLGVILCILVDTSFFCRAQSSTKTENGLSTNQNLSDSFEPLRSLIVPKSEDQSIHAKTGTEQEPIYDLDYLMNICPYADICSRAGQIVPEKGMVSCCQSCSCDPTCEARGKCCNDTLNIEARKRCYRPLVAHSSLEPADTAYIFIDTCLNSPAVDCKSISSEPWGSMYPVYDSATDTFYYNQHCADCNGIKNYTHWEVMVSCFDIDTYSNDHIIGALYGKTCDIIFTPPNIQLEKHVCFVDLIHQCNVSGLWQNYDAGLELACSTWYSPVNWLQSLDTFANVFCLLCNGYGFEKENLCSNFDGRGSGMLLTTTIDYRKVSSALTKSLDQQTQKNDELCQKNMVRHPTKAECRAVSCPDGYFRSGGECVPLSIKTVRMTYTIQIEMTPTMDDLLPMSLLQSMARDKSKSLDSWFQSRGIPLEYFHLYAEPITIKNASFARKIIARVGKMNAQVMIENVLNKIQKALSKEWQIMSHDQVYSYSVNIDKFKTYVIDGLHERFNEVEEIERQDVTSDVTSEQVVKEKIYEEIIFRREQHAFYAAPLIYLTKMNFCEKVHLERSEWIGLYQEIRLNLTGSKDERVLGDSEYNIYSDDQGKAAVAICVDDFNPLYNNKMSPNIGSANRSISKSVACVYTLYFFAALLYI